MSSRTLKAVPPPPIRPIAVLAALIVAMPVLAGCARFSQEFGARELVVIFAANATPADAARVRAACPGKPPIKQQPKARGTLPSNLRYPLRYDITGTNDAQQSALIACLGKDPSVVTVNIPEAQ